MDSESTLLKLDKKNTALSDRRAGRMHRVVSVVTYLFLSILVVVYLAPLCWMLSVSFKTNAELFTNPFGIPQAWDFENYRVAWSTAKLGMATLNSAIVSGTTLLFSLLLGAMASFALGRMKWKLSGLVMSYFLIGMMVPTHCVLIPLFVKFAKYQLTDSLVGLILPYITFSLPMTIFILTGFFRSMQGEMFEAACIDGANIYECFFRIALPLSRTGLFVTGLMTFVANWNELLLAMVFISDEMKKTLPVALTKFAGPYATNYTQMFAAIIVAVLPTIIVYCCFSNQIVEGLTQGAVKG